MSGVMLRLCRSDATKMHPKNSYPYASLDPTFPITDERSTEQALRALTPILEGPRRNMP